MEITMFMPDGLDYDGKCFFSMVTAAMTEPGRNTDMSLVSLLAGFKVELHCGEFISPAVEIECNMTDSEVAHAFAGIQKVSVESMKSIFDSLR
ncbi:hypothetical protein KF707_02395 [Candidatus Obscuribacterales bacterium]|nr:hypothetical protein [Candidatus Obscuribacterales bacterium]